MGWRRHPKNLPLCAGKLNSLLYFPYTQVSKFPSANALILSLILCKYLTLDEKASSWLETMDWLPAVSAGTDPMFMYTNGYVFIYLFIMVIIL